MASAPEFIDEPGTEKPFAPYFRRHIAPKVAEYEALRREAAGQLKFRVAMAILGVGSAAVLAALVVMNVAGTPDMIFVAVLGSAGALGAWAYLPVKRYHSDVKGGIFPLIFPFFGDNFHYSEDSPLSVRSLIPSDIIPDYDKEYTEDYVRGSHKDVGIEMVQARMTQTHGSGKNRRTVEVFKGLFVILGMNKNFSGKTILRRDYGSIGNFMANAFHKLERVALEDPVFEKRFEVLSSNQVEARYLLTTSFMERVLALCALFPKCRIQASFYGNRLLLMIATNTDHFKLPSIFKPVTFVEETKTILAQMQVIFRIIETLRLDEKTRL